MQTLVVAHRGGAGMVDRGNTVEAFEMAIRVGAPMAELDVHQTVDGAIVVHHDHAIGEVEIARSTLSEVRQASAGVGYPVSTLIEIFDLCRGRIQLDIEVKTPGFEAPLLREVDRHFDRNAVVFKSFHDRTVRALKALDTDATVGLLVGWSMHWRDARQIATELFPEVRVLRCGADFVSPNQRLLKLGFVRRLHKIGVPVWVWTVNDPRRIAKLMGRVDALITDRPDIALGISR